MSGLKQEEEEVTVPKKEVHLFGKNIAEVPCFRNSFIFGICSGVAGGLVSFMFTSKARLSTHTAFASLWVGVFLYWLPCRYNYESRTLAAHQLKKSFREFKREADDEEEDSPSSDSTTPEGK